jgi:Protein kinase domain.
MNIMHHDLKPSNILITPHQNNYDHVHLTNFDLAKLKHKMTD